MRYNLHMDKRLYTSEEVVERIVEALMLYKRTLQSASDTWAEGTYNRIVKDIKTQYGFETKK